MNEEIKTKTHSPASVFIVWLRLYAAEKETKWDQMVENDREK